MTDDDLVDEVGEWAIENFGTEQPPAFPLIGAGEEAGELTRSILKRAQGIDDSEKYADRDDVGDAAEQDAIGDVVIYTADMLYRLRNDIGNDEHIDGEIDRLLGFYAEFGNACAYMRLPRDEKKAEAALDRALTYLEWLADERGFDYEACVSDAWEEVSGRTWDSEIST